MAVANTENVSAVDDHHWACQDLHLPHHLQVPMGSDSLELSLMMTACRLAQPFGSELVRVDDWYATLSGRHRSPCQASAYHQK